MGLRKRKVSLEVERVWAGMVPRFMAPESGLEGYVVL